VVFDEGVATRRFFWGKGCLEWGGTIPGVTQPKSSV